MSDEFAPLMIGAAAIMAVAALWLGGCSRTQTETVEEAHTSGSVALQGVISVPDGAGGTIPLRVDLRATHDQTTDTTAKAESVTKADLDALGASLGSMVKAGLSAGSGGGIGAIGGLVDSLTGGGTMAAIGYLALKKRQQMRTPLPARRRDEDETA